MIAGSLSRRGGRSSSSSCIRMLGTACVSAAPAIVSDNSNGLAAAGTGSCSGYSVCLSSSSSSGSSSIRELW